MALTEAGDLRPSNAFKFEWKVERFYEDCKTVGDGYKSPAFPIHYPNKQTKWYLLVYPKGDIELCKDSVSLFLCYECHYFTEVTVDLQLSIVGKQNSLSKLMKVTTSPNMRNVYGWSDFEKQDVIKNPENDALINDTLTISCEITFDSSCQNISEKLKDYHNLINKIGTAIEDFEGLLESNCCSGVTFYIQDKIMHLHRVILMRRSSVFHAMFEEDVKEKKESIVEITDVDWQVMEELFRFIYSEKFEYLDDLVQPLLIAADKYGVTELKAICERILYTDLTVNNAIEYLKLTDECNTIHLKTLTIEFVVDHYKDIVGKSEFEDLPKGIMCDIVRALAVKA